MKYFMDDASKEVYQKQLGKQIRRLREERNLSQSELGALFGGRDKQVISRFENGMVDPKGSTLIGLAKAFGIRLAELMNFDYDNGDSKT